MARVTGVGGVFLRSPDPKRLSKWYADHLGFPLSEWGGVSFEWTDEVPKGTGATAWSTVSANSDSFGPAQEGQPRQAVMINYRVDDMDALLASLAAKDVWVDPKRDDSDFGKFAWIRDCDGNRVELWEPVAEK